MRLMTHTRRALPAELGGEPLRRRRSHFNCRFNTGAEGGDAGDGWPNFEIPNGVGGGAGDGGDPEPGAGGTVAANPGNTAAASPAGAQPGSNDPGATPNADGTPQGGQPRRGDPAQFPPHRVAEIIRRNQEQQEQLTSALSELNRLRQGLGSALGFVQQDGGPKLKPEEQRVVDRLFQLIPGLPKLLELEGRLPDLNRLMEMAPQFQQTTEASWNRFAVQQMRSAVDALAPVVLNDPAKKGTDLTPVQRKRIAQSFYNFVNEDPQRVQRYEMADTSLVTEFKAEMEATYFGPARRVQNASVAGRAAAAARLPQGGNAAPTATGTTPPNPADEDAVHKAGWGFIQNARTAAQ